MKVSNTVLRNGWFNYQRSVPKDLLERFGSPLIRKALNTKDPMRAAKLVEELNKATDKQFRDLRNGAKSTSLQLSKQVDDLLATFEDPLNYHEDDHGAPIVDMLDHIAAKLFEYGAKLHGRMAYAKMVQSDYEPVGFTLEQALSPVELVALSKFKDQTAGKLRLSHLMSIYRANHIDGDDELKMAAAEAKMLRLIKIIGDKDLKDLTREDAAKYRDKLLEDGLKTGSVKRNLSAVVAVINKAIIEKQLNIMNPLAKLTIKNLGNDVKEKVPYSLDHLRKLFELTEDPKNRLNTTCIMLQLQASLCCNLKEIALLTVGDINLTAIDSETGSIHFRPNTFRKSLKTDNRVRLLPLYGRAREAAIRALEALPSDEERSNPNQPLFPAYAYDARGSDNATATLNKRLKDYFTKLELPVTNTTSYRHWSITRMRNANVNMDLRHAVSGHSKGGSRIHDSYGEAHGLKLLLDEVIKKIEV